MLSLMIRFAASLRAWLMERGRGGGRLARVFEGQEGFQTPDRAGVIAKDGHGCFPECFYLLAWPGEPGECDGHGRGFEERLHLRRNLIAHVVVYAHHEEQGVYALIPRHGFSRRLERLALRLADHQGNEVHRIVLGRVVG